jgi:hypothetical protein
MTGFRHGPNMDSSANNADHLNQLTKVHTMKNATIISATLATLLMTSMMSGTAAAAQECGARQSMSNSAIGAFKGARIRRATRQAKRSWEAYIMGAAGGTIFSTFSGTTGSSFGLGSRFADLDNAKNVVINCKGAGRGKTQCTVTATPCTK